MRTEVDNWLSKALPTRPLQDTAVMREINVVEIFTKAILTKRASQAEEHDDPQYCRVRIPNNHQLRRIPRYYKLVRTKWFADI